MNIFFEDNVFKIILTQDDALGPITYKARRENGEEYSTVINLQSLPIDAKIEVALKISSESMIHFSKQAKYWRYVARRRRNSKS